MARIDQVAPKIKRAKKHIADLDAEIRRFFSTNPYKVGTKRDPESRKLIYYLTSVEPTPDCLSLIAGDAIQNLMSALDHLAYQLVCLDTGDNPPNPNWIYFPIQDTFEKYKSKKGRKIEGAHQPTINAIDALKPYKGGNDLLWSLYRLNNVEKHRLLITVGSSFHSVNVGVDMLARVAKMLPGKILPIINFFAKPKDILFPLKAGDELLIGAPDDEVNEKMQFRFEIALNEPGVIEGKSLLETVHQFANLVDGIVTSFEPRLR